ncbi:MAG: hypothetical protein LBG99_04075 [Propionibacteriaceae bacterium]|nr:hypothetical protein [Propionibacteriaceae bacterium]
MLAAAIALGLLLGMAVAPLRVPEVLQSPTPVTAAPVVSEEFFDPHTVSLMITTLPGPPITVAKTGLLTSSTCIPGMTLKSGQSFVSIDGQPLLALSTIQPLWRELVLSSTGSDVNDFIKAINALGAGVSDQSITRDVVRAYENLLKSIGGNPGKLFSIDPSFLIWLPAQEVTISSCDLSVGKEVTANTTVAMLPPVVVSASVRELPKEMMPGDRQLIMDGAVLLTDELGRVTESESLARIASTSTYRRALNGDGDVTTTWSLVNSVEAWVIPPSAVTVNSTGQSCIVADGKPVSVSIVGSQLGRSYVVPEEAIKVPEMVSFDSTSNATCG